MNEDLLSPRRWTPGVRAALLSLLDDAPAGSLAVFDWDNTCIYGDIGESTLLALDHADGGDRMHQYETLVRTHGKIVAYAWCAEIVGGRTPFSLWRLAEKVLEAQLERGAIRFRPEIRELISVLQRRGWEVWIVSASQETLVQAAAQRYGIAADRVIGVRLSEQDGVLERSLDGPLTFRQGKVDAIRARIGRTPTLAVGDTDTDIEMLEAARFGLVIDSGNAELGDRAATRGWWVQPPFERV